MLCLHEAIVCTNKITENPFCLFFTQESFVRMSQCVLFPSLLWKQMNLLHIIKFCFTLRVSVPVINDQLICGEKNHQHWSEYVNEANASQWASGDEFESEINATAIYTFPFPRLHWNRSMHLSRASSSSSAASLTDGAAYSSRVESTICLFWILVLEIFCYNFQMRLFIVFYCTHPKCNRMHKTLAMNISAFRNTVDEFSDYLEKRSLFAIRLYPSIRVPLICLNLFRNA